MIMGIAMKRNVFKLAALVLATLIFMAWPDAAHAQNIACGAGGNFGTVNTQATITGPNNMTMDYSGNITYAAPLSGPATGTEITCLLWGWGGNSQVDIDCDATRTIANTGGCCGQTNRTITAFTVRGSGSTTAGPTTCNGIGGARTIRFNVSSFGIGTIKFGARMDATQVRIGGSYALASHATGPLNIEVKRGGTTRVTTANLIVTFASLVGFTSVTNLAFGTIALAAQPGAADHVDLGTNGTATYTGVFAPQGGTLNAGQVTMNNIQNGVTVEVYCDTSTTMTNGAGKSIQVTGLKVAAEGSTGSYAGAGVACTGSGAGSPATTMVYAAGTRDQFFLGGVLDGGTASPAFPGGSYATSNSGGVYANVIVLTQ